jgi:hypothetical protein
VYIKVFRVGALTYFIYMPAGWAVEYRRARVEAERHKAGVQEGEYGAMG